MSLCDGMGRCGKGFPTKRTVSSGIKIDRWYFEKECNGNVTVIAMVKTRNLREKYPYAEVSTPSSASIFSPLLLLPSLLSLLPSLLPLPSLPLPFFLGSLGRFLQRNLTVSAKGIRVNKRASVCPSVQSPSFDWIRC